jgi:hypothetical protein
MALLCVANFEESNLKKTYKKTFLQVLHQLHLHHHGGMVYGLNSDQPLLKFSENEERASFIEEEKDTSMSRKKNRKGGKRRKVGKRALKGTKGLKFSKGRLALRLSGFGLQKLGASELVKFIPLSKLKQAAKKVLRGKGTKEIKRRKQKKRKSEK